MYLKVILNPEKRMKILEAKMANEKFPKEQKSRNRESAKFSAKVIKIEPIYPSIHSHQNPFLLSLKTHLHYLPKINPLLPVKSSTPPWLLVPPTIRFDLTNLQKTDNNEYKSLLSQIIAEYPDHI